MSSRRVTAFRLEITIGESFLETITWKDANDVLVPFPSGTTAEIKVRPRLLSEVVLLRFTSVSPAAHEGLLTLVSPGVTQLSLTPTASGALTPTVNAVFDIRYVFPSGLVDIKLQDGKGYMSFVKAVTR